MSVIPSPVSIAPTFDPTRYIMPHLTVEFAGGEHWLPQIFEGGTIPVHSSVVTVPDAPPVAQGVPEPGTWLMFFSGLCVGLIALAILRKLL
jgi:hypothetical protein